MSTSPPEPILARFLAHDAAAARTVAAWARDDVEYRRLPLSAVEVEDVVQQTLLELWRLASRPEFAVRVSLRAIVRRIAVARTIDALRSRRARDEVPETLADDRPDIATLLARADDGARVRWAAAQLGAQCRDIVRLHFEDDLPFRDIAARNGLAESSMRVRLFRCLRQLREIFLGESPHR